jgi:site-specific recombinase XerD
MMELVTLEQRMSEAEKKLMTLEYREETRKAYLGCIRRFLRYWEIALKAASPHPHADEMVDYINSLSRAGKSAATLAQMSAALSILALAQGLSDKLYWRQDLQKKPPRKPLIVHAEEAKLVLRELRRPHDVAFQLMYGCGLRVRECAALRWELIDLSNRIIHVIDGKCGKQRMCPFSSNLQTTLEKEQALSALVGADLSWVFCQSNGEHAISVRSIQSHISKAAERVGIKRRVTCHMLRHSFATYLRQHQVGIRSIQEILGHSSLQSTIIYTHEALKAWNLPCPLEHVK